jgi:hypothetical protein
MNKTKTTALWHLPCLIALLSCGLSPGLGQDQQTRRLVINGQAGEATVIEIQGHSYVDVAALARIANGSVNFQGTQVVVSLPSSTDKNASAGTETEHSTDLSFSRTFVNAAFEEIALLREWASPLANAIRNGYPVTEDWVASYRAKAANGLAAASAAVSTSADQSAFQLLTNEFETVKQWSNKLLDARKSMSAANYSLSADALRNDPQSQKIITCGHFLTSMLAGGSYQDDSSCHS